MLGQVGEVKVIGDFRDLGSELSESGERLRQSSWKAKGSDSTRVRCLSRATERPMVPTPE